MIKGLVKIVFGVVALALGAALIIYGTDIWNIVGKQLDRTEVNGDIRMNGPTGPPYVKGPTGPPPE